MRKKTKAVLEKLRTAALSKPVTKKKKTSRKKNAVGSSPPKLRNFVGDTK